MVKHSDKTSIVRDVKDFIHHKFFENPKIFPKITYSCGKYSYCRFLYDDNITVNDVVFEVKTKGKTITKEILQMLLKERSKKSLRKALWEICIVTKPIDWKSDEMYPLILRINHGVTDGIGLLLLMKNYLSDESLENYWKPKINKSKGTFMSKLKDFHETFSMDMLAPVVSLYLLAGSDRNDLCRKRSGHCCFAWFMEDDQQLLQIIRNIRKKIPDTTFSDVIKTTLTVCLKNYFQKVGEYFRFIF